jgi:hypothetical protein
LPFVRQDILDAFCIYKALPFNDVMEYGINNNKQTDPIGEYVLLVEKCCYACHISNLIFTVCYIQHVTR